MDKPGRNDPCLCGSGKKYRKCCLPREEAARPRVQAEKPSEPWMAEMRPELDERVDEVLGRLQQGAGRAVESEIKSLPAENPGYHSTQFAMGVHLAMVMKDYAGSIPFFERAVGIFPPFPEAHFNLGNSALKICDIPKALGAYRAAIRFSNGTDGIADLARNELQGLEKILLKSSPFPSLDAYVANAQLFDQAFVCLSRGDHAQAVQLFKQVLAPYPHGHVQSFGNLALAYAGLGQKAAALECLEKALALDPGHEPAISNRRIIENMREGEPSLPGSIQEIHYYAERLNRAE